jgi:hypothetical protein
MNLWWRREDWKENHEAGRAMVDKDKIIYKNKYGCFPRNKMRDKAKKHGQK